MRGIRIVPPYYVAVVCVILRVLHAAATASDINRATWRCRDVQLAFLAITGAGEGTAGVKR